jgi:malonyl-CoA/methylmalonyl-CoA synthetase
MPNALAAPANLYAALRAGFPVDLDAVAIETAGGPGPALKYSWRDIDRASARLARLLDRLELPPQSRIAAHVDKSVEALMLYLAVLRAGHVYLPLNIAYQASEIDYFFGNAEPAVVVCNSANFSWVSTIAFRSGARHVFTLDDDRSGSLLSRAVDDSEGHVPASVDADDLAVIVYTSGTTGRSKGAMLSHGNLLANALTLRDAWGWASSGRSTDVLIHALPIFHVHGLFVANHAALLSGSKMIWFSKFSPRDVIARFADATVFMGVPTLYTRLLAEATLTRAACEEMRLFISGSAPLLIETFEQFRERSGHTILERYGMSETVMLSSNPLLAADGPRRGGTVGKPLPGVGIRISDDQGRGCASGEIGAIEVSGPNIFAGYWRMPEKSREEFVVDGDGTRWFKTGDVGRFDDQGYLSIVGRARDLIISGGYNVYPAEIESLINDLPGVAESAVVGVAHPDFGEGVVAIVVAKAGAALDPAAMLAEIKRQIANYKVPKHLFVVADLPRNAMGKVQKNQLREQHRDLFAK